MLLQSYGKNISEANWISVFSEHFQEPEIVQNTQFQHGKMTTYNEGKQMTISKNKKCTNLGNPSSIFNIKVWFLFNTFTKKWEDTDHTEFGGPSTSLGTTVLVLISGFVIYPDTIKCRREASVFPSNMYYFR